LPACACPAASPAAFAREEYLLRARRRSPELGGFVGARAPVQSGSPRTSRACGSPPDRRPSVAPTKRRRWTAPVRTPRRRSDRRRRRRRLARDRRALAPRAAVRRARLHPDRADVNDVYAAGDATALPIRQGAVGTQQADAAAEHIAARLGAPIHPKPFHPVLRGKLLTGAESLDMRRDPTGGRDEGIASADHHLWWPPHKVQRTLTRRVARPPGAPRRAAAAPDRRRSRPAGRVGRRSTRARPLRAEVTATQRRVVLSMTGDGRAQAMGAGCRCAGAFRSAPLRSRTRRDASIARRIWTCLSSSSTKPG
jgi:hypothetical protein